MANNHAFIKGNLTHDPTFDYLDGRNGEGVVPFMRFNVAVDREGPHYSPGADFLQVVAYGKQALHDHAFLRRGSEVAVTARLRMRRIGENGRQRILVELVANDITFVRNIDWARGQSHWRQVQSEQEKELIATVDNGN